MAMGRVQGRPGSTIVAMGWVPVPIPSPALGASDSELSVM